MVTKIMRKYLIKSLCICLIAISCSFISGCIIKPYKVDIQQGNILKQEDVSKIKAGMSKEQVESILGEPMLRNSFDADNWTYVYTNQINGGPIEHKCVIVHFVGNRLVSAKSE